MDYGNIFTYTEVILKKGSFPYTEKERIAYPKNKNKKERMKKTNENKYFFVTACRPALPLTFPCYLGNSSSRSSFLLLLRLPVSLWLVFIGD